MRPWSLLSRKNACAVSCSWVWASWILDSGDTHCGSPSSRRLARNILLWIVHTSGFASVVDSCHGRAPVVLQHAVPMPARQCRRQKHEVFSTNDPLLTVFSIAPDPHRKEEHAGDL